MPLFKMSVGNILDMKEGDFLPMDRRATSSVLIKTVGVPLFRGVLGESEGRKAVKIEELVRDERA
ncbi:MAG TPA: FliM/FliN family flagellar motor switch protein [Aquificaceae bacterium]|nr:FliM/FliN family flagellar motor switch protein [Aquificaceae bacterium]